MFDIEKKTKMFTLQTLPQRATSIIVEEDISAPYGKSLMAIWLREWTKIDPNGNVELITFANPKSWYLSRLKPPSTLNNVKIIDYYSNEINKSQENVVSILQKILSKVKKRAIIFIDNLDSLILYAGLAHTLQFVELLKKKVIRLICFFRRDCIPNKIASIETLANTYVKLYKYDGTHSNNEIVYIAKYIHRKQGGTVMLSTDIVKENIETYNLQIEKLKTPLDSKNNETTTNDTAKIVSSFRIEINEHEMKQRENTPLPYVPKTKIESKNEFKILYIPEEFDDMDEEDPDDDLCL